MEEDGWRGVDQINLAPLFFYSDPLLRTSLLFLFLVWRDMQVLPCK